MTKSKTRSMMWLPIVAAFFLAAVSSHAQPKTYEVKPGSNKPATVLRPTTGKQDDMPALPFKAPPGQTIKITSSYSSYDFSKLNREIPLPMQAYIWQPSEVKAGYKVDTALHKASKRVTELYQNLSTLFPEIGPPSRVVVQGLKGKQGPGTILYVEYPVDMPADARPRIARRLYGSDTTPAKVGEQIDQHLISKNMFIVWSFKDRKSLAKEAHQKKSFELVSLYANEWDKARKAAGHQTGK